MPNCSERESGYIKGEWRELFAFLLGLDLLLLLDCGLGFFGCF
jgi:hypothetical protein